MHPIHLRYRSATQLFYSTGWRCCWGTQVIYSILRYYCREAQLVCCTRWGKGWAAQMISSSRLHMLRLNATGLLCASALLLSTRNDLFRTVVLLLRNTIGLLYILGQGWSGTNEFFQPIACTADQQHWFVVCFGTLADQHQSSLLLFRTSSWSTQWFRLNRIAWDVVPASGKVHVANLLGYTRFSWATPDEFCLLDMPSKVAYTDGACSHIVKYPLPLLNTYAKSLRGIRVSDGVNRA